MFGLESRVIILERALVEAGRTINALIGRVERLEARAATGGGGGSNSGGMSGAYVVQDSGSGIPAGSTANLDVSEWTGGGYTIVALGVTVFNPNPDDVEPSKLLTVSRASDGGYLVNSESCSTV